MGVNPMGRGMHDERSRFKTLVGATILRCSRCVLGYGLLCRRAQEMTALATFLSCLCSDCGSVHVGPCSPSDVEAWERFVAQLVRERHAEEKRERLKRHRLAVMQGWRERHVRH